MSRSYTKIFPPAVEQLKSIDPRLVDTVLAQWLVAGLIVFACPKTFVDTEMSIFVSAADHTDIKNDFGASRESLPTMFIATPNDRKVSVWTKKAPSVQVCRWSSVLNYRIWQIML